jgi:hypothetical protein
VCGRGGGNERHYILGGQKSFPALKVLRQCPLVLLVEVSLTLGKDLKNEKGKVLGFGLSYEQRREVEQRLYCL